MLRYLYLNRGPYPYLNWGPSMQKLDNRVAEVQKKAYGDEKH